MKYQFNKKYVELLSSLPETGMGSQHITIHFKNGSKIKNVTVFNCQDFELDALIDIENIAKVESYKDPNDDSTA